MNEHGHRHPNRVDDIVDQIDALTEDAASWSATGEHAGSLWSQPAPGAMTAVELAMTGGAPIEISATEPVAAIAARIGDPFIDRISHLRRVAFWVGGNSVAHHPVNTGATTFLHHLLADVRDGNYVASDDERDHARLLLTAGNLPEIHGPCLVTGIADDGDTPAPLDENFQGWFTGVLDELAQRRASLVHAIARELGLSLEQLDGVSVVFVGSLG
ncbi:hypothetical protein [Amycolatopsis magusensis]|uniref:hypothetical protein n=1 Tax=Amycolatopsis magusensis TaxID=882444 RepID=UPI003788A1B8